MGSDFTENASCHTSTTSASWSLAVGSSTCTKRRKSIAKSLTLRHLTKTWYMFKVPRRWQLHRFDRTAQKRAMCMCPHLIVVNFVLLFQGEFISQLVIQVSCILNCPHHSSTDHDSTVPLAYGQPGNCLRRGAARPHTPGHAAMHGARRRPPPCSRTKLQMKIKR